MFFDEYGLTGKGMLASMVLVIIVIMLVVFALSSSHTQEYKEYQDRWDSFRQHCVEAGGHMYQPDNEGWCLKNGLMLEVYP